MSLATHFAALSAYGATAVRIHLVDGEPHDVVGQGGQLQAQFDALGQRPLVSVLRDPQVASVTLADGGLEVVASRAGNQGRLQVSWDGQQVVDEQVEIPNFKASWGGAWFRPEASSEIRNLPEAFRSADPLFAVHEVDGETRWYRSGWHGKGVGAMPMLGQIPAVHPETLGSDTFKRVHGVKWAYVAGAMAGGIASADLVMAMAQNKLLGFYGAGGLPLEAVETALQALSSSLTSGQPWGANLLHNPAEPAVEERTVDLYLKYGVRKISASAYMGLSPAVVRYRLTGIHADLHGQPICPNRVFAKVSRPEVAEKFLRPAPQALLDQLVEQGVLTAEQARLAKNVPIATDITAEADSGGHTDHRPLVVLLPLLMALRDQIAHELGYRERPRVGAAGGLGTGAALWSAFSLGADFVLTGSVNQATLEAGTSEQAKQLLTQASYTDVASGPAPDMFEIGAKVQVLSRGTMYAQRAQRLYDTYKRYDSMDDIPAKERARLEKQMFKRPLGEVWQGTRDYWQQRDPEQVARAEREPKHQMALTFRWYLGMTSRWARMGEGDRKRDYQIWCGPAMGAFNSWVASHPFAALEKRTVADVARLLMNEAAAHARVAHGRTLGLTVPTLSTLPSQ